MPKGKKQQTDEEVLGQIFDFIFKEAKKPVQKRKPLKIKMGGPVGSTELGNALAAVLEKPGLYITDQALDTLGEALTIEVARMKANEIGSAKVGFSSTSIVEFLSDPNKALKKAGDTAKAMRKSSQMAYLGRWMTGIGAVAWAQKYNLDLDARKAIRGYYEAEKVGKEAEASRALGTASKTFHSAPSTTFKNSGLDFGSEKNHLMSRASDLVGRELFTRAGWERMTQTRKDDFQKMLIQSTEEEGDSAKLSSYLTRMYPTQATRLMDRYKALAQDVLNKDDLKGISNTEQYLKLENRNLDGRIADLNSYLATNTLAPNQVQNIQNGILGLEQAKVIISGQHLDSSGVDAARANILRMMGSAESDLIAAQRRGDRAQVAFLQDNIKKLKKGKRQLDGFSLWGNVGKVEGVVNSWKNIWSTNAVAAVLDGSFYDKNRNLIFNPAEEAEVTLGFHNMVLKDENGITRNKRSGEKITVFAAAKSKNPLHNAYNNMMTNLYYLTPKSLMKTMFVNGEGFVYLSYLKQQNLLKDVNTMAMAFPAGVTRDAFVKTFGGIDIFKLATDQSYRDSLVTMGLSPAKVKELVGLSKLSRLFSAGQRFRERAKEWMDEHVFKRIRQKIYNSLINKMKDEGAKALLGQWLAKGGIEVLAKSIVVAILDALGIAATGGAGSVLVPILSAIVVDILYGVLKTMILILLLISAGVVGIMVLGGSKAVEQFNSMTYAYTNVVPGEVVSNPNFTGTSPIIGEDDPTNNMGNFVGGTLPAGEKCLLGSSSSFHCSQGPFSVKATPTSDTPSHMNVAAIDVTGVNYFYAPSFCGNNNCKVTYAGEAKCSRGSAGGMMKFTATYGGNTYEFTLIHVQPGVGSGAFLSSGQRVARVMTKEETTSACSTGMHIHIQAKMNGKAVDPRDVLNNNPSSGGFSCNINECPHEI